MFARYDRLRGVSLIDWPRWRQQRFRCRFVSTTVGFRGLTVRRKFSQGEKMKKLLVVLALVLVWVATSAAQEKTPLRLVQTISLPELQRHWDHFGVDTKSNRRFLTSDQDEPGV